MMIEFQRNMVRIPKTSHMTPNRARAPKYRLSGVATCMSIKGPTDIALGLHVLSMIIECRATWS